MLIYPQAEKYAATQRDPFAAQFDLLRRSLAIDEDNTLAICGYSFGDAHINGEIRDAMSKRGSKTTVLASTPGDPDLPAELAAWHKGPWGERVYSITGRGIVAGTAALARYPNDSNASALWTFGGLTRLLKDGAEEVTS